MLKVKEFYSFLFDNWLKIPEKLRFLLVGGFNTVVSYLLFVLFLLIMGQERYQLSLFFAWVFSSFISFATQKNYVFCTKGNWLEEYSKCLFTWGIAYVINAIVLEIIVRHFLLSPLIAQVGAVLLTTIITYILFKNFVFKKEEKL